MQKHYLPKKITWLFNVGYNIVMQQEVECKFLNVDHDDIRSKLRSLGAICEYPMRMMRRVMFDHVDARFQKNHQHERLRVRDEGDKVTITYKKSNETDYAYEVETTVGSFEDTRKLLKAIGLVEYSYQESKRETWEYKDVEVVLDEWPWIHPYIEIEGKNEKSIKQVAVKLGFEWEDAKFGSVDTVYRSQYPNFTINDSVGDEAEVKFGMQKPDWFDKGK